MDLSDAVVKQANAEVVDDLYPDFTGSPTGCSMSDRNFTFPDKEPYIMEIGKVVQWSIDRLAYHPLHTHVSPFQIQKLPELQPNTTFEGGWFEAGDFTDTLFIPQANFTYRTVLRFQPGPYAGYTVVHCHFLNHEDAGCMHVMNYYCPEGATMLQEEPFTCSQPMPVQGTFTRSLPAGPNPPTGASSALTASVGIIPLLCMWFTVIALNLKS